MKTFEKLKYYYGLSSLRQGQGHAKVSTQLFEMAVLFLVKGIGPGYYHSAQLWRKDKTWKYKFGWLSEKKYRKRVSQYNPSPYQKISQNKLSEKALLSLFKIPSAGFIGFFHPKHGRDGLGKPFCNGTDVLRALRERDIKKFCIKELEGWGGRGFQAFEIIRTGEGTALQPIQGGQAMDADDYFRSMPCSDEGLVFEAYIEQHPTMKALNATSLNTIRILVVWPHDADQPQVVGAFVRIGRAGSLVDNTTSGGLAAVVDVDSGLVGPAHYKLPHPDEFDYHPDHRGQIKDVVLPYWDEVKTLVCNSIKVVPKMRFCGFDVAISMDGPKIVELNVEPDKTGLMQIGVPIAELLKGTDKGLVELS